MGHTGPDYGGYAPKEVLSPMADLAELAARLHAYSRYDRLGDVIFLDGFDDDLGGWETAVSGAGASAAVTAERMVSGGFSLKLVGGSDGDRYAEATLRLPVPYSLIYGFEWCWSYDDNVDNAYALVSIFTGALRLDFGVRYDAVNAYNQHYDSNGVWQNTGDSIVPYPSTYNFITAKFTVDIATVKYSRFIVPPLTLDIAGISGKAAVDATNPHMQVVARATSKSGVNGTIYVDHTIVTMNDE